MEGDFNSEKTVFLVVGSDTGIGKTVFSGLFVRYLEGKGLRLHFAKPFCSGSKKDIEFLEIAGHSPSKLETNYWYHDEPVSPAAWEMRVGKKINFDDIVSKLKEVDGAGLYDISLIEGVGGLLAPITRHSSVASLGQKIGARLIIVAPNRVGVVNHILLTLESALSRSLSVDCVILMEQKNPDASAIDNAELIGMHLPNKIDFKGIFEFPWLGTGASNPDFIASNVKKAESVLEKIFDTVVRPFPFGDSTI